MKVATLHGRSVIVLSHPRRIAGGEVVQVTWAEDNKEMRLPDGSVHPAHRHGFTWEEPVVNLTTWVDHFNRLNEGT